MNKEETRKLIPIDRFITVGHHGPELSAIEIGSSFLIEVVRTIDNSISAKQQIENAIEMSDGILVISRSKSPTGYGSLWVKIGKSSGKPFMIADPSDYSMLDPIAKWIKEKDIRAIAIGGPKEMKHRSLYVQSSYFLGSVLNHLIGSRVFLPTGVAGKIEHSIRN
jgi:hypothetical protein